MATGTNILEFPDQSHRIRTRSITDVGAGQRKPPETSTAAAFEGTGESGVSQSSSRVSQSLRMSQAELYPSRQAFSRDHITALRLLKLAVGRSKRALDGLAANDAIAADTQVQRLQVLLPELFCCRSLGDGFGTVINAFMSAFETLGGDTPDASQIRTMNRVLQLLREMPFLSADEADKQLELLESVGLSPYPAELLEFLSSDKSLR